MYRSSTTRNVETGNRVAPNVRKPARFLVLFSGAGIARGACAVLLLLSLAGFRPGTDHPGVSQTSDNDSLTVIMRFGGDVLLSEWYEEGVSADIHRAFDGFDLFHTDHLSVVNLESPVTQRGVRRQKPFTFRTHPRFLETITRAGIEAVSIANNHIYDFGKVGLYDTIAFLDSMNIGYFGAGKNHEAAHRPFIREINGVRVAILGYYGGGEAPAARRNAPGVADRELNLIVRDVRSAKNLRNADLVIVCFHWGTEKARRPDRSQRAFARAVIDAGADAVIGHHPHVLQGIELYKNKPIVYSLGNLIFGGNSRHSYDTGVFEIRLTGSRAVYSFIPVRVTNWQAAVMTGPEADRVLAEMRKLSSIFRHSIFN